MTLSPFHSNPAEEQKRLYQSAGIALGLELLFFLALGIGHLPLFRNPFDSAQYVEAQILQLPANSHLTGAQATTPDDEVVFNPHHRQAKRTPKPPPPQAPEQNKVEAGPDYGPTHGPVALYSPSPVIPTYLRDQNLKTSVVIEFLITAQGQVTPRLLESSGNNELDSIALNTVTKWQFKPAAQDNVPVDSKTRLRILFEVY
jgi:TonB family protein